MVSFLFTKILSFVWKYAEILKELSAIIEQFPTKDNDPNYENFGEIVSDGDFVAKYTDKWPKKEIVQNYTVGKEIELDLDIEELFIDSQTMMPLSLLINEIITNSLKYAFEGREEGLITVKFNKVSDTNELIISDDGIGFVSNPIIKGLGFRLIASFTRQLDGSIEKIMGSGTTYKLVFSNI